MAMSSRSIGSRRERGSAFDRDRHNGGGASQREDSEGLSDARSGEANAIGLQAGFEQDVPDRIDPGCEMARGLIKESAGRPSPSPDATANDYCFLEG